jgi:hypothetical protein
VCGPKEVIEQILQDLDAAARVILAAGQKLGSDPQGDETQLGVPKKRDEQDGGIIASDNGAAQEGR